MVAIALFVYWFDFATDMAAAAGLGAFGYVFLWLAFGANLLRWTVIGLLRLGDDSARSLVRRRARERKPVGESRERVLVGSGTTEDTPIGGVDASDQLEEPIEGGGAEGLDPSDIALAVIIPAHNEEPVIKGAISSALSLLARWDV